MSTVMFVHSQKLIIFIKFIPSITTCNMVSSGQWNLWRKPHVCRYSFITMGIESSAWHYITGYQMRLSSIRKTRPTTMPSYIAFLFVKHIHLEKRTTHLRVTLSFCCRKNLFFFSWENLEKNTVYWLILLLSYIQSNLSLLKSCSKLFYSVFFFYSTFYTVTLKGRVSST